MLLLVAVGMLISGAMTGRSYVEGPLSWVKEVMGVWARRAHVLDDTVLAMNHASSRPVLVHSLAVSTISAQLRALDLTFT